MSFFAAVICIILGFIAGFVDGDLLFNSTTWFIASIAFSVLPAMTFGNVVVTRKSD